jgi:hypothetical protein
MRSERAKEDEPMRTSMRAWMGMAIVAVLGAAAPAAALPAPGGDQHAVTAAAATDVSARQRRHHAKHRHARRHPPPAYRHTYVYAPRGYYDYYARPHWYRPNAVAPFFPFGFGWGLGPSW